MYSFNLQDTETGALTLIQIFPSSSEVKLWNPNRFWTRAKQVVQGLHTQVGLEDWTTKSKPVAWDKTGGQGTFTSRTQRWDMEKFQKLGTTWVHGDKHETWRSMARTLLNRWKNPIIIRSWNWNVMAGIITTAAEATFGRGQPLRDVQ